MSKKKKTKSQFDITNKQVSMETFTSLVNVCLREEFMCYDTLTEEDILNMLEANDEEVKASIIAWEHVSYLHFMNSDNQ